MCLIEDMMDIDTDDIPSKKRKFLSQNVESVKKRKLLPLSQNISRQTPHGNQFFRFFFFFFVISFILFCQRKCLRVCSAKKKMKNMECDCMLYVYVCFFF